MAKGYKTFSKNQMIERKSDRSRDANGERERERDRAREKAISYKVKKVFGI